jgi:tRNA(fMet)-specific endonuclease VapC
MSYLLDTNICSAYLKRPAGLAHRFQQHGGGLAVPSIVLAELYTWAYRRDQPGPLLSLIEDDLLADIDVIDFDADCARWFGQIRAQLLAAGQVVNPVDMMIGAVALAHDLYAGHA